MTESSHVSFVYEENECSLVVLSAGTQDGGVYTCTARNPAGEVSCKAELAVRSGAHARGGGQSAYSQGRRCEPWARSHSPDPSHPSPGTPAQADILALVLSLPSALPGPVSALILLLPAPPNTSSDSHGGRGGRGSGGTARKETQRLLRHPSRDWQVWG